MMDSSYSCDSTYSPNNKRYSEKRYLCVYIYINMGNISVKKTSLHQLTNQSIKKVKKNIGHFKFHLKIDRKDVPYSLF